MANSGGVIVTIVGQDDTSKVFDQIEERMRRAATPAANLGKKLGDGMEHAVPQVAAASAAIRLFEGQIPIRAVERLITMVPGLGAALQVAFPVVGGIVFGEMIVENIVKLRELYKASQDTARKTGEAFGEATDKIRAEATQIEISNDRLEEQIAKLEKKPSNGLKLAIDEALESAQKLGQELRADAKTIEGLTKANETGFFARLGGQASTDKDAKDILTASNAVNTQAQVGSSVVDALRDRGASLAEVKAQEEKNLSDLQAVYDKFLPGFRERRHKLLGDQNDKAYKAMGGDDNTNRINMLSGAIEIFDQQQRRAGGEFYQQNLKGVLGKAEASHANDELSKKAEEAARKQREAANKLDDSKRKLQQTLADEAARAGKAQADTELEELDAKHKSLLLSDVEYYRQRGRVQEESNARELVAERMKMAALNTQIGGLQNQNLSGNEAKDRDAKVNELAAERLKIVGQIAATEAKTAIGQTQNAEQIAEADQKRIATANEVRARLEASLGGTAARLQQSRDAYYGTKERPGRQANLSGQDRVDADRLQGLDEARIGTQGAEEDAGRASGVLGEARRNVAYRQKSGAISSRDAKTQGFALDAAQANQLQKVVDAYQKLADGGDLGAVAKVAELNEQIAELRNPIDETAEALRDGFGRAFDGLLENIGEGTRSFEDFGRTVERIITQQVAKQFIEPGLQAGLGRLIPGRPQAGALPAGVDIGSVVRPTMPGGFGGGVAGALGLGGDNKKVSILLNITQNKEGGFDLSSMTKQGDDRDDFEAKLANSFDTGGILKSLFGGH